MCNSTIRFVGVTSVSVYEVIILAYLSKIRWYVACEELRLSLCVCVCPIVGVPADIYCTSRKDIFPKQFL